MKPHGIMFHHFHNDSEHIRGQGSISAGKLEEMILYLQKNNDILSADEWMDKALRGTLKHNELCLSFDDNLKCQHDIAYPVLQKFSLKAFWFVYTSPLEGKLEKLEIYRYFRFAYFQDVDDFYNAFFTLANKSEYGDEVIKSLDNFIPSSYLKDFSFYTDNDRTFRYLRDQILKPTKYHRLMEAMLYEYNIDFDSLKNKLWMTKENVFELHKKGHKIGLHTHSHPTSTADLDSREQMNEYKTNLQVLSAIIGETPDCMSHPCNSYNHKTIEVLKELHIKLGFRSNMKDNFHSLYEFPREDHANILRKMEIDVI